MSVVDVARLPRWPLRAGTSVHRIFRRFGPDGQRRSPWFFSSAGRTASGRFDLPAPRGTCYFASTPVGAWLEVFRSTRLVDAVDVRRRHLATATRSGPDLRLADLASGRSAAAGVSLDLMASDDYSAPQAVAASVAERGDSGLRGLLRHDPSGSARNIALFGTAGSPSRQSGWRVVRTEPWRDASLMRDLGAIGIHVMEIPHNVPITAP